jgi:predicted transcriptional regulator
MAGKRATKRNDPPPRVTLQELIDSVAIQPVPAGWYTIKELAKMLKCSETYCRRKITELGMVSKRYQSRETLKSARHYYFPSK